MSEKPPAAPSELPRSQEPVTYIDNPEVAHAMANAYDKTARPVWGSPYDEGITNREVELVQNAISEVIAEFAQSEPETGTVSIDDLAKGASDRFRATLGLGEDSEDTDTGSVTAVRGGLMKMLRDKGIIRGDEDTLTMAQILQLSQAWEEAVATTASNTDRQVELAGQREESLQAVIEELSKVAEEVEAVIDSDDIRRKWDTELTADQRLKAELTVAETIADIAQIGKAKVYIADLVSKASERFRKVASLDESEDAGPGSHQALKHTIDKMLNDEQITWGDPESLTVDETRKLLEEWLKLLKSRLAGRQSTQRF